MTGIDPIDPPDLPEPSAAYAHGTMVRGADRMVFVSGQPPWAKEAARDGGDASRPA